MSYEGQPLVDQVVELRKRLRHIGAKYKAARLEAETIRQEGVPIVETLARIGVPQRDLAADLQVTRNTVHRIETLAGVDRGDPRSKDRKAGAS